MDRRQEDTERDGGFRRQRQERALPCVFKKTVKVRRARPDLSVSHGEVSDPDQDEGERPPAHDQPLLSGCKGARAVFGTQALGKGSGGPAPLSCPP